MLDDVRLGLNDIKKNKLSFFLCAVICTFSYSIFISATSSMINEIIRSKESTMSLMTYQVELIDYKVDDAYGMLNNLSSIYKNNNFTFLYTPMKINSGENTENVYIILGDIAAHYGIFKSEKQVALFVGEKRRNIVSVTLQGTTYPVQDVLENNHKLAFYSSEINTNDNIFLVIQNPNIVSLIGLEREDYIYNIIANTCISNQADSELFLEHANCSFVWVAPHKSTAVNGEVMFVITKLYPYLLCLIIGYLIMSIVFISYTLQKQLKEFYVYLICGATIKNIMIRVSTYYAMIFFTSFMFALLLQLIVLNKFAQYTIIGILHYTVINFIIFFILKRPCTLA